MYTVCTFEQNFAYFRQNNKEKTFPGIPVGKKHARPNDDMAKAIDFNNQLQNEVLCFSY